MTSIVSYHFGCVEGSLCDVLSQPDGSVCSFAKFSYGSVSGGETGRVGSHRLNELLNCISIKQK